MQQIDDGDFTGMLLTHALSIFFFELWCVLQSCCRFGFDSLRRRRWEVWVDADDERRWCWIVAPQFTVVTWCALPIGISVTIFSLLLLNSLFLVIEIFCLFILMLQNMEEEEKRVKVKFVKDFWLKVVVNSALRRWLKLEEAGGWSLKVQFEERRLRFWRGRRRLKEWLRMKKITMKNHEPPEWWVQ